MTFSSFVVLAASQNGEFLRKCGGWGGDCRHPDAILSLSKEALEGWAAMALMLRVPQHGALRRPDAVLSLSKEPVEGPCSPCFSGTGSLFILCGAPIASGHGQFPPRIGVRGKLRRESRKATGFETRSRIKYGTSFAIMTESCSLEDYSL